MTDNKLNRIDYLLITFHLLIIVGLYFSYQFELLERETQNKAISFCGIAIPMALYSFYFKRLRLGKIVFIWGIISIIQIIIFYLNYDNYFFIAKRGSYLDSLTILPTMLISFRLLRFLFKLIYKQELIITALYLRTGEYVENRKLKPLDFTFSILGGVIFMILPMLILK